MHIKSRTSLVNMDSKLICEIILVLIVIFGNCMTCSCQQPCDILRMETTLTSPNYPSNYDDNYNNQWRFTVEESQVVALQFDDFHLEDAPMSNYYYDEYYYDYNYHGYENEPCLYDWVRIYELCHGAEVYIWQGCGPQTFTSPLIASCSTVYLLFVTDSSATYRGFSLRYWGYPGVQEIDTAWFEARPLEAPVSAPACAQQVRSFMDCALQVARNSAQSFDYNATTRMCDLYLETSGLFDVTLIITRP